MAFLLGFLGSLGKVTICSLVRFFDVGLLPLPDKCGLFSIGHCQNFMPLCTW